MNPNHEFWLLKIIEDLRNKNNNNCEEKMCKYRL